MIIEIASHFSGSPVLVVTGSWFGNNGLFKPVRQVLGLQFNMLSRLRISSNLYDLPAARNYLLKDAVSIVMKIRDNGVSSKKLTITETGHDETDAHRPLVLRQG